MYKFSPILSNTLPFKVQNGNIMVYDDNEFKNVINLSSSLLDILNENEVLITSSTILSYLKSLGIQYVLNQFIINDFSSLVIPNITINDDGSVEMTLSPDLGITNVKLEDTPPNATGRIIVTTKGADKPSQVQLNPITGVVTGLYDTKLEDLTDLRFIQHYGVDANNNDAEYWCRTGNKAHRLVDNFIPAISGITELLYCYDSNSSVPVPPRIIPDLDYKFYYVDDNESIPELTDDKEYLIEYEDPDRSRWVNLRLNFINNILTNSFIPLRNEVITLNNSIKEPTKSVSLTRLNYISDYVSFIHNVGPGKEIPVLKSQDYLYYEFDLLEYCYNSQDEFPDGIPFVDIPTEPVIDSTGTLVHDGIIPDKDYKLRYDQVIIDTDSSISRLVKAGDVVEVTFEYKFNNLDEIYDQTIDIVVGQIINDDDSISPFKFNTLVGIIFEITEDNLVMYSINTDITDYRIVAAHAIV